MMSVTYLPILAPGRYGGNFKSMIFKSIYKIIAQALAADVVEPHQCKINFGSGNGIVRQHAITSADVKPALCRHMAVKVGENEVTPRYIVSDILSNKSYLEQYCNFRESLETFPKSILYLIMMFL